MKRWKFLAAVTVVIAAASLAACGGSSPSTPGASPTAPTSPSTPAVTGATITGTVQGLVGSSAAGHVGARDVITVTVAGTTITATIDSQGTFVLNGVPAGTVTLTFSGTSATVTLQNVGQSGKIKIVIVISGSTATVETEQRVTVDGQAELEGRISSFGTAAGTFYVGDILVTVGSAPMRHGDTPVAFTELKVGDRVHVTGTATGVGTPTPGMTASLITVQNTNAKVPVNLKGAVSGFTGTCGTGTQFVVEGWTVKTTGSTDFRKGSCTTDLKNGADVHVKGDVVPAAGAVLAYVQAEWVQFGK